MSKRYSPGTTQKANPGSRRLRRRIVRRVIRANSDRKPNERGAPQRVERLPIFAEPRDGHTQGKMIGYVDAESGLLFTPAMNPSLPTRHERTGVWIKDIPNHSHRERRAAADRAGVSPSEAVSHWETRAIEMTAA